MQFCTSCKWKQPLSHADFLGNIAMINSSKVHLCSCCLHSHFKARDYVVEMWFKAWKLRDGVQRWLSLIQNKASVFLWDASWIWGFITAWRLTFNQFKQENKGFTLLQNTSAFESLQNCFSLLYFYGETIHLSASPDLHPMFLRFAASFMWPRREKKEEKLHMDTTVDPKQSMGQCSWSQSPSSVCISCLTSCLDTALPSEQGVHSQSSAGRARLCFVSQSLGIKQPAAAEWTAQWLSAEQETGGGGTQKLRRSNCEEEKVCSKQWKTEWLSERNIKKKGDCLDWMQSR